MTPTRLRECLAALHWSQRGLADVLDYSEGTVRGWARGARAVPPEVAEWLETLAAVHVAHPAPKGWNKQGSEARAGGTVAA